MDAVSAYHCLSVACHAERDVHALRAFLVGGCVLNLVVQDLRAKFVIAVDSLEALVLEHVVLDDAANLLWQFHIAGATHVDADVASLDERVPECEEVVVPVGYVFCEVPDDVDALLVVAVCRCHRCVQPAVVYGDVAALVLDHNHGVVINVFRGYLKVLERDIVCAEQCDDAISLLVLVRVVAPACGVLVVEYLHVALSALRLQCQCVVCAKTLYPGD